MDAGYNKKLLASALTVALIFSSLVFLAGAQAGAGDDLEVSNLYETAGSPPPRANVPYEIVVGWKNFGDTASYDATVRLYSDCSQNNLENESASITMGPDESGSVILNMTFENAGEETCYSATIYHDSTDYGEFENYINVEPETGDALLWIEFDMESNQATQGQDVDVEFTYGNDGDVSTLNPVTFMGYFNKWNDETLHSDDSFAPSPLTFDFISPPPEEAPPEQMQWQYTIPPQTKDGRYKFTVVIDSEENNTEDPDLDDNVAVWEICVGDCSEPDLQVRDNGIDSILAEPFDAVAGTDVSFIYSIVNMGEGDAEPPQGPASPEFLMHLEVMKCPATEAEPGGDCGDQEWETAGVYVNQSKAVKTPIEGVGCEGPDCNVLTSDEILGMVWSTDADDAGFWNVRVIIDAGDGWGDGSGAINETNEGNNDLDWYKVKSAYFELKEQRPDLTIPYIDEGPGVVYQDNERTITVIVSQTVLGDKIADDVAVYLKIKDPDGDETAWFRIDDNKTVFMAPDTTSFEYQWTPLKLGWYEFFAWVDMNNQILEWPKTSDGGEDGTNNQFGYDGSYKDVLVQEKLPDLQVTDISISPLDDNGQAKVGVSSSVTVTIANLGVRDMTSSEGSMLEVAFNLRYPRIMPLATINVNQSLAMDETVDVTLPFIFEEKAEHMFQVYVDYNDLIDEAEEDNNEKIKTIFAQSAMDAYVSDLEVPDSGNDGLAGKEYPITFVLGMSNVPSYNSELDNTYILNFTVSVDGTFGFSEVLALSMENTTVIGDPAGSCSGKNITVKGSKEYCPIGTGYQISGLSAFLVFDSSYTQQTVVLPWIPNAQRSDTYNVTVEVDSDINVVSENDTATYTINIEKLTTNLVVESIRVTDADGSATIKVTVGYPQGEKAELDEVFVGLEVYRASDYADDEYPSPIDTLAFKPVSLLKGDSRPVSFTWAVKNGDYIFVAIVDPENKIREINELDNSFPSLQITFGDTTETGPDEEEDEGLFGLPAPSLVAVIGMFGLVALARRRS